MNSTVPKNADFRNLLFISYAYEDQIFAKWLARKLAFYGYGVWIDQIQILGGESWVKEVDIATRCLPLGVGIQAGAANLRRLGCSRTIADRDSAR